MPNNTANKLTFATYDDSKAKIDKVIFMLKGENRELDFNKIIPCPDNENQTHNDMWGTKWGAYSIKVIREEDHKVTYFFETAWNWPKPIIDKIFEMFNGYYINYSSACEGGFFAVDIRKDEDSNEVEIKEWSSENSEIINAMHNALDV